MKEDDYININDVKVLPRLGYGTAISFYKKVPFNILKHFQLLKKHISGADTVLLVAPACTLPLSYFICRILKKPLALYIVGDVVEVIRQDKSHILIKCLKLSAAKWEWLVTRYISKKHTTFCLGSSIYNKLSKTGYNLKSAMTSLVADDAIIPPDEGTLNSPVQILSVSRLSKEKGIHVALEAISNIYKETPVVYTIIGDGPELEGLKDLASQLGLNSANVIFTGYLEQSQIREHYINSDIFVLPSLSEGIPKVILDAMAAAIPIISTRVGGIPDLLSEDSSRGWLVQPNNAKELESALQDCINNSAARHMKVLNANSFIKDHTAEKEASRIESVLLGLSSETERNE
jgi:glycosyltransferase involved in cell wall biosynthesis